MRLMSFAMTPGAIRDRSKTVTRRIGWQKLPAGEQLQAIDRSPRSGKGFERLAVIETVDVRREPLRALLDDPEYGAAEMVREGLPGMPVGEFIGHFGTPADEVTRIEFRYVEAES
jgi:hypothetical protein